MDVAVRYGQRASSESVVDYQVQRAALAQTERDRKPRKPSEGILEVPWSDGSSVCPRKSAGDQWWSQTARELV